MNKQAFADLFFHRMQRIQGRQRLLENGADTAAAQGALAVFREPEQVFTIQGQGVSVPAGTIRQQIKHRQGGQRLAGAGLTDQRQHVAGFQIQGQVIYGHILAESNGQAAQG